MRDEPSVHDVPPAVARALADAVGRLRLDRTRGGGRTAEHWGVLAATAATGSTTPGVGLDAARLAEAHLDAATILAELGAAPVAPGSCWGVWAAESREDALVARRDGAGGWCVDGTKPWCSGLGAVTHALVTARADDGARLLAVAVDDPGVNRAGGTWAGVGMRGSGTGRLRFDAVAAGTVGGVDAYLERPGFWHGAAGVAAAWYGGAVGALRPLTASVAAAVAAGDVAEPHAAAHLGAADAALDAARAVLRAAAAEIDRPGAASEPGPVARRRALRVRATVEQAVETTLRAVARATGARPLAHDPAHAAHVADLEVYVRQSHAERDLAVLGALAADVAVGSRTDLGAAGARS